MAFVILAALFGAGMFILLKGFAHWGVGTRAGIVINYAAAAGLGMALSGPMDLQRICVFLLPAIGIGIAFIVVFYVTALSAQKAGVAATTVASKMSMILPILAAVIWQGDRPGTWAWVGIVLALAGVVLSSWKPTGGKALHQEGQGGFDAARWLPIILFFAFGIIDSSVSHMQHAVLRKDDHDLFTILVFCTSMISGWFWCIDPGVRAEFRNTRTWTGGIALGLVNYGALYFLIAALANSGTGASRVFPMVNIGIVGISAIGAVALFKERLSMIQYAGLVISVAALLLIMYTE